MYLGLKVVRLRAGLRQLMIAVRGAVFCLSPIFLGLLACAGADNVPPSPNRSWYPPKLGEYEAELARETRQNGGEASGVRADTNIVYDLPALIDLAQRSNPQTRVAWERARQAAEGVGLSQSAYFPYLVASAGVGYERAFIPWPTLKVGPKPTEVSIVGGGQLATEAAAARAMIGLKWLLLDFGGRKAVVTAAKEDLMAANVGFNAIHQRIVFTVTQRYYGLTSAQQKVAVAESSLSAADTVRQAAVARRDRGLATTPEVLQAEQQWAQASFDLEAARGVENDARVALVESLGILPTTRLQVAKMPDEPVILESAETREQLIERALSQRPDLVADLANLRARRAGLLAARAEFYPKITADANAGGVELDVSIVNSPYFGAGSAVYGGGISIEFPIFDGFARKKKLEIAKSEVRSAEAKLAESRDAVIREVWKAHTDLETAVRKQESAAKLLAAAESAFTASVDAYRQGVGTYVDVAGAQHGLTTARSVSVDTRSAIHTAAAALALSVGDLARPTPPPPSSQHPK
jgi:outer membrane protein TolC